MYFRNLYKYCTGRTIFTQFTIDWTGDWIGLKKNWKCAVIFLFWTGTWMCKIFYLIFDLIVQEIGHLQSFVQEIGHMQSFSCLGQVLEDVKYWISIWIPAIG